MSVLCRNHLQGQMLHAILSTYKVKKIDIHSPHLSVLARSEAIDSQLSGSYDSACLQIRQLLSKVPCARASYKAFLRPLPCRVDR